MDRSRWKRENGWSYEVGDRKEFKKNVLDHMESEPSPQTFMFRARPSLSCESEGVKMQLH